MATTHLTAEELLGIVPIDESDPNSIPQILIEKKKELDAIETRKSKDYYENLREREGDVDYGA